MLDEKKDALTKKNPGEDEIEDGEKIPDLTPINNSPAQIDKDKLPKEGEEAREKATDRIIKILDNITPGV